MTTYPGHSNCVVGLDGKSCCLTEPGSGTLEPSSCTLQLWNVVGSTRDITAAPVSDGVIYYNHGGPLGDQFLMGSFRHLFDSIYSGTPDMGLESGSCLTWTPNTKNNYGNWPSGCANSGPYQMYTDGTKGVVGPINVTQNANYIQTGQWSSLPDSNGNVRTAPYYPVDSNTDSIFKGCDSSSQLCVDGSPGSYTWMQVMKDYQGVQDLYNGGGSQEAFSTALETLVNSGFDSDDKGQQWQYPIHMGNMISQGFGGRFNTLIPNLGGMYAMKVAPYPQTTYDPSTINPMDLSDGCNKHTGPTLAPSYGFLSYCTEDIVLPNAFDMTGPPVTITCPTTVTKDSSGKPVTAPGLVCIQGSDSDTMQLSDTVLVNRGTSNTSRGAKGSWPYWQTADLAPSCLDVSYYFPGSTWALPQLGPTDGVNFMNVNTQRTLEQNVNGSIIPNMTDSVYCIPPPQSQNNAVPRCFIDPSSKLNPPAGKSPYDNLFFKTACLSQQPFETWGHYASLSNNPSFNQDAVQYDNSSGPQFNAPSDGVTSSLDVQKTWWMSPPISTALAGGQTTGGARQFGAVLAGSDGALASESNVPGFYLQYYQATNSGNPEQINMYGYQARNPSLMSQGGKTKNGQPILGMAPLNDMSPFYAAYGLTTFQGTYGAVPGSADNVSSLSPQTNSNNKPAWQQTDMLNWINVTIN